jgi:hypothetical protein
MRKVVNRNHKLESRYRSKIIANIVKFNQYSKSLTKNKTAKQTKTYYFFANK